MRSSTNAIPTVDLDVWRTDPKAVAAQVDTALQRAGFLLVTGHGVDAALPAGVRAAARRFFNNAVQEFNTGIQQFPAVLFAASLGFTPQTFFDVGDERPQLEKPPQVKF